MVPQVLQWEGAWCLLGRETLLAESEVFSWNRENLGYCCRVGSCGFPSCIPCSGDRVSEVMSLLMVWLSGN